MIHNDKKQGPGNERQTEQGHEPEPQGSGMGHDQNEQELPAPPQEAVVENEQTQRVMTWMRSKEQ